MERSLTIPEKNFLRELLRTISLPTENIDEIKVKPLNDEGMGSLFIISDKKEEDRKFEGVLFQQQFVDVDEVPILVTLHADQYGDLFELDIWKADFSPVIKYPQLDT